MTALTAQLMAEGYIDARPAVAHNVQTCTYCDYRSVCFFDDTRNSDRIRYIPSMKASNFYSILQGGEEDGSELD